MNYERKVEISPVSQSPENEAIHQIFNRLMSDFALPERISILKDVQSKIHHDLMISVDESEMRLKGSQNSLQEFENAFHLVMPAPQNANKY